MEALFVALMIAVPVAWMVLTVRRFRRIARALQNPQGLEQRLEVDLQQLLARAGIDPAKLRGGDPEPLRDLSPELQGEVRKLLLRTLFTGWDAAGQRTLPPTAGPSASRLGRSAATASPAPEGQGGSFHRPPELPLPIDHGSRMRSRLVLAAALVAIAGGIAYMLDLV